MRNQGLSLEAKIMETIQYLLKENQTIPIEMDEDDDVQKMIGLEGTTYLLYTRTCTGTSYESVAISGDEAVELLKSLFSNLDDLSLNEEAIYWEELAAIYREELEQSNKIFPAKYSVCGLIQ